MTAKETERLARVEQKVTDLIESTDKGFKDLNTKIDKYIDRMDSKSESFITVAQARVAAWFVGTIIGIASIAVLIWGHLTK